MKIRTSYELNEALDNALAWRKKELTSLRFIVDSRQKEFERVILRRAAVPVLYAHWEGFAKEAATIYLELVNRQGRKYNELRENFVALAARGRIRQARESRRVSVHLPVVQFLLSEQETRARIPVRGAIDTEANLSSTVLREILATIGLPYNATWSKKALLLDGSLLKMRNEVAHGEKTMIDEGTYSQLHDLVLDLLNYFKNDIENAAILGHYARALPVG
jgi:hypothetical protein